MGLKKAVLIICAIASIFIFETVIYFSRNSSVSNSSIVTERVQQSFEHFAHADKGISRWLMIGVALLLIFFRLRRKHQIAVGSKRLLQDLIIPQHEPERSQQSRDSGWKLSEVPYQDIEAAETSHA